MATTTPNFGWSVPTSTDLVKDGATAIETLGDAIDASLVDLKGGTTGQVLAKASATDMDFTWVTNAGDIEGVTAGVGISGGGTSGTVTITNSMATAIDAKGDLVAGTGADAFSRLAVGANNTVLTADSAEATGLKWATPSSGGMTLITSGTLSGATVTLSSIPTTYNDLQLIVTNARPNTTGNTAVIDANTSGAAGFYTGYNSSGTLVGSHKSAIEFNPSGNLSNSDTQSVFVATFYDYARATTSRLCVMNGRYDNTSVKITYTSTLQLTNTAAALTSLLLKSNNTWAAGSYYLYGVK